MTVPTQFLGTTFSKDLGQTVAQGLTKAAPRLSNYDGESKKEVVKYSKDEWAHIMAFAGVDNARKVPPIWLHFGKSKSKSLDIHRRAWLGIPISDSDFWDGRNSEFRFRVRDSGTFWRKSKSENLKTPLVENRNSGSDFSGIPEFRNSVNYIHRNSVYSNIIVLFT
jgi:hypothetical protein